MVISALPEDYRKSPPFTVSFDWTDSVLGLGYIRFFPCGSFLTAGQTYFLSTKVLDSAANKKTSGNVGTSGSFVKKIDIDFDLEIIKEPLTAKGTAYVNLTGAGIDELMTTGFYWIVKVVHVDTGATETTIGTGQSTTRPGTANKWYRENITIDLTETLFAFGEKIRITIEGWANDAGGGSAKIVLYHDPASVESVTDADGVTRGTDITIDMPFKVEV